MKKIEGAIKDYSGKDLANTFKQLEPSSDRKSDQINCDFDTLMLEGYVIIKGLISPEQCRDIKNQCLPLMSHTGRNKFEGQKTQRLYNVLSKTRCTDALAEHPRILGLMDLLFRPNYLLSQSQVINILPGENQQASHYDDGFYQIPRPRPPLGAASIWAIDDFTEDNGATVVFPQSHHWDGERRPDNDLAVKAIMPAGSVIFFLGTTWHGGGANQSDSPRLAMTHQYCEAFLRQQENFLLELDRHTVNALSPVMQSLVGYSIYPPFMGMVDGKHPLRTLKE